MKKGFTLVELAIVLVVIGIITGLAIRGLAMIDAARFSAEYAKISKLASAFALYFEKNGKRPPLRQGIGGIAPTAPFIYDNTTLEDFGITTAVTAPNLDYAKDNASSIELRACAKSAEDNGKFTFYDVTGVDNSTGTPMPGLSIAPSDSVCVVFIDYSEFFFCSLETLYDDVNIYSGHGALVTADGARPVNDDIWRKDLVVGMNPDKDYVCKYAKNRTYSNWGYMVF